MGKTYFYFRDPAPEPKTAAVPDVYWDGKPEHGLPDDPNTGKPMVFGSKREKADWLQANGLREAGDRRHGGTYIGAPVEAGNQERSPRDRDAAMRALHQVKQMGIDVRRQAYLKIIKENRRG